MRFITAAAAAAGYKGIHRQSVRLQKW